MLFDFPEVLKKRGFVASDCRLLRHDRTGLEAWRLGRAQFGAFVSYQKAQPDPYARATFAFHFVPGPVLADGAHSALFVGAHRILDRFPLDRTRQRVPRLHHPFCDEEYHQQTVGKNAFDLAWLDDWDDLSERILIRWGSANSTRAWSQWARNAKEVVEFRLQPEEQAFPGFSAFATTLDELKILPRSWRRALGSVGGVYLLVCQDTGQQYVGSAYGADGFWGRWSAYDADGHGGNVLLKARGRCNYAISILEIASPDMAPSDIIARETAWKIKLGSRAHGLNSN